MKKYKKILLISLVFTAIAIYFIISFNNPSPIKYIEDKYGSQEIREILLEKDIDDWPVFIYTNNDEKLVVLMYDGLFIGSCHVSRRDLNNESLTDYSWFQDNNNNHRVVWGICKSEEAEIITVNGKKVQSEELRYTYNGEEQVVSFWYIVLEKDFDYKVRNTGDDYNLVNECRVYLDDNE